MFGELEQRCFRIMRYMNRSFIESDPRERKLFFINFLDLMNLTSMTKLFILDPTCDYPPIIGGYMEAIPTNDSNRSNKIKELSSRLWKFHHIPKAYPNVYFKFIEGNNYMNYDIILYGDNGYDNIDFSDFLYPITINPDYDEIKTILIHELQYLLFPNFKFVKSMMIRPKYNASGSTGKEIIIRKEDNYISISELVAEEVHKEIHNIIKISFTREK